MIYLDNIRIYDILISSMGNLKQWIADNLQYSRGLICKKCKREWFEKYGFLDEWQEIHKVTSSLDILNPTFPQRIWHIVNNQPSIKCANLYCQNTPTFWSFNIGYLKTCSYYCAQHNSSTREKIKQTNIQRYGTEYGLQSQLTHDPKGSVLAREEPLTIGWLTTTCPSSAEHEMECSLSYLKVILFAALRSASNTTLSRA